MARSWPVWPTFISILAFGVRLCRADDDSGYDHNPILDLQPPFARSLPVQILLTGIVFTLTAVLLFHLIFTAQYHWPLAPVNYALQFGGVSTLFVNLIATIIVILRQSMTVSKQWPYMLTYLAVEIPPAPTNTSEIGSPNYEAAPWSTAEITSWYVMDATVSALVQITHIQFLTLMYPSRLEARLILFILGPIAVTASAMQLLPLQQSQKVVDIADTIRNICNATLSLLFTAALFIWGFLVNRKQAWRTDGGTAAFGAGALTLALVSTALNFLYIPAKDQYMWLPRLIWAVVLWQSFLGWWWWVGGGRGVGEVEELLRREERRERKRRQRAARRIVRKEKAQALWQNASETLGFTRRAGSSNGRADQPTGESIELTNLQNVPSSSSTASSSPTMAHNTAFYTRILSSQPVLTLLQFFRLLRHAHLAAAHSQALERRRRRRQAYGAEVDAPGIDGIVSDTNVVGWGLGSFGIRERERQGMSMDEDDLVRLSGAAAENRSGAMKGRRIGRRRRASEPIPRTEPWSIWWLGPLRRWRLQDSTAY